MELTKEQSETIKNCDVVIFSSYEKPEEDEIFTHMTFFKTDNTVEPTELGHKYNILMFRKYAPTEVDVDLFTAILGDPEGYVRRIGKMGYHGIIIKRGAVANTTDLMNVFRKIMKTWGFKEDLINKSLVETVV